MAEKKLSLEAKVDKILEYSKKAHRRAIRQSIIWWTLFVIFIVLPIIAGIYLSLQVRETYGGQINQLQQLLQQLPF